jgi:four helix bundle protein
MKHNFKELNIWQRIRAFIVRIYHLTDKFPMEEKYGLASQIRRASISSSLNIIEGTGRSTEKQLAHFLDISYGSLKEVQGCLIHAFDLGYISKLDLDNLENESIELQKMLFVFRKKIMNEINENEP